MLGVVQGCNPCKGPEEEEERPQGSVMPQDEPIRRLYEERRRRPRLSLNTMHEIFEEGPMYRKHMVENAFEIWLWNRRPWSNNLREYPYLNALFDLELIVFQAMVKWYYDRTPSSRRSEAPIQPAMGAERVNRDGERVRGIIQRLIADRVVIQHPQGVLWSGPSIDAEGPLQAAGPNHPEPEFLGISVLSAQEIYAMQERRRTHTGARSSHETPYPEDLHLLGVRMAVGGWS